jgi:RNA polymerase sigma-70 factor, ECF subfamily
MKLAAFREPRPTKMICFRFSLPPHPLVTKRPFYPVFFLNNWRALELLELLLFVFMNADLHLQTMNNDHSGHDEEPQRTSAEDAIRLATFDQYRGLLFSIAYRMLGTIADAEDMLQETFIRWHKSADQDIRSPRAFLVTIISRLCMNHLQSARVQREEYVGQWLPEPLLTDPNNDPLKALKIDESLSMAFLVLLERLTPVERAVFLLHEVFNYKHTEIAEILDQSEANCRQVLRRARQHVGVVGRRFKASTQDTSDLFDRFLQATRTGDMDGLVALLARDVVLHSDGGGKAVAVPRPIKGADKVARGILRSMEKTVPREVVGHVAQINGKRAVIGYLHGKPFSVVSLNVSKGRVKDVFVVTNPDKLAHLPRLHEG